MIGPLLQSVFKTVKHIPWGKIGKETAKQAAIIIATESASRAVKRLSSDKKRQNHNK